MVRSVPRIMAAGLVVFLAGIARDVQWHATHNTQQQFETASKQVEVHWLLWLGVILLFVSCWLGLTRATPARSRRGLPLPPPPGARSPGRIRWGLLEAPHRQHPPP